MQFGKIRDLREDHDLKQCEIAKVLGVKRTTYAMWELGDVNFPIEKLVKLASYFHTNVEYMLDLTLDKREVIYSKDITVEFIGRQLKRYRLKLGKTQREFAKVLNIRQSSYSYYEDDYNYYLFLETDADGRIMAYGGIGGNFQTISYGEGSNYPFFVSHLSGTALYDIDTNKVYALILGDKNVFGSYYEEDLFLKLVSSKYGKKYDSLKNIKKDFTVKSKTVYRKRKLVD